MTALRHAWHWPEVRVQTGMLAFVPWSRTAAANLLRSMRASGAVLSTMSGDGWRLYWSEHPCHVRTLAVRPRLRTTV